MPLYHGKNFIKNIAINFEGLIGIDTSDATITSSDQMLSGVTAYGASGKVVGTIPRQTTLAIIPNNDVQIAVPQGVYTENDVKVEAIPSEYITTSDATAIASDIMSGKTAYINGEKVTGTFSIDAEITAQEEKIAEQDAIIANLMTALEGKAAGGGSAKTTKTIYLDWSGDAEQACWVQYISNNEIVEIYAWDGIETIEAEGGIVNFSLSEGTYASDNFIAIGDVYVATQDGETIYFVSGYQQ
jgi:hypothetical protein